jgi:transposase
MQRGLHIDESQSPGPGAPPHDAAPEPCNLFENGLHKTRGLTQMGGLGREKVKRMWSALGLDELSCWTGYAALRSGGQRGQTRWTRETGVSWRVPARVVDLLAAGLKVADVARDLGVSEQAVYCWRGQERIDRGLEAGPSSLERVELAAVQRRVQELEAELAVYRRAALRGGAQRVLALRWMVDQRSA